MILFLDFPCTLKKCSKNEMKCFIYVKFNKQLSFYIKSPSG